MRDFSASGSADWAGGSQSPAWPSWSSADVRLAKATFYGSADLPPLEALDPCFSGSEIKTLLDAFLSLSPKQRKVLGQFFRPASSTHFGLRFSLLVLEPNMCGVKKETGSPNRPHDGHDVGSWGAAGRLKCAMNPNNALKIHGGQCLWL